MNLTLALLAGLILLLPGLTAIVAWNLQGSAQGAKRPELQLTSISALFVALAVAIVMHLLGFALAELARAALIELGHHVAPLGPLVANPYAMMIETWAGQRPGVMALAVFLGLILYECLIVWRLIASQGLDLVLESSDVRTQGWVFEHVVRPLRHGYTPIAYVLTSAVHGEYGVGYEGIVADIRQGDHGELRSISLAEPQRFVYQLVGTDEARPRRRPKLVTHDREWVGGVVALDGAMIRNIVIQNVSQQLVAELAEEQFTPDDEGSLAARGSAGEAIDAE
ncbi:hypothetical protein [Sphingopyxis panaciterrae]